MAPVSHKKAPVFLEDEYNYPGYKASTIKENKNAVIIPFAEEL